MKQLRFWLFLALFFFVTPVRNVYGYTGIRLPYPGGTAFRVSGTHGSGRHARDWAMTLQPVVAMHAGTVYSTGWDPTGGGNILKINHGDGYCSVYLHLDQFYVSPGQFVAQGQVVAKSGNTGNGVYHLHASVMQMHGSTCTGSHSDEVPMVFDEYPSGELPLNATITSQNYYSLPSDYNGDGRPDLWAINKQGPSNSTEIHIISGANPHEFLFQTGTALHQTGQTFDFAIADYNRDGKGDLWAINKQGQSNTTEIHVLSGANPQQFLLQTATALHPTGQSFVFLVADYNRDGVPDLWAINKQGQSNSTEIHILSGADPEQFLFQTSTALHPTDLTFDFVVADYNRDGVPDLWAINRQGQSNTTEIHILSGANPQQFLLQAATALHQTDQTFEFAVGDYDREGTPDLWAINRHGQSNTTEIHIISGVNPQQFLFQTDTILHPTNQSWCFNGGSCLEVVPPTEHHVYLPMLRE